MNEKIEKALDTLGLYIADDELKSNAREALATLKAALEQKEAHIKTILQDNASLKAELEKARPLIEAVMGANARGLEITSRNGTIGANAIIREALAYKEQHET